MAIEIFSTDTDSGVISVIRRGADTAYLKVAEIVVGNAPRGSVKFTADGRGFVSNTSGNTVSELDGLNHSEVARITVGSGPRGIAITSDDRYMLVSNSGSDTVSIVDLNSREEVTQVAVGRDPRHMAIIGRDAYICLWGDGAIAKLDVTALDNGNPVDVRYTGNISLGRDTFPYSLNIDSSRMIALVACNALQSVPVVDLRTDTVIADVAVRAGGARAVAFTRDGRYALVTLERDSSIAVIDLDNFMTTRYIDVGPGPRGIAVDGDGVAYSANFSRPAVMRFDVADYGSHSVSVIDMSGSDLSTEKDDCRPTSVRVGFGPCSVSVFDSEKARTARDNLGSNLAEV